MSPAAASKFSPLLVYPQPGGRQLAPRRRAWSCQLRPAQTVPSGPSSRHLADSAPRRARFRAVADRGRRQLPAEPHECTSPTATSVLGAGLRSCRWTYRRHYPGGARSPAFFPGAVAGADPCRPGHPCDARGMAGFLSSAAKAAPVPGPAGAFDQVLALQPSPSRPALIEVWARPRHAVGRLGAGSACRNRRRLLRSSADGAGRSRSHAARRKSRRIGRSGASFSVDRAAGRCSMCDADLLQRTVIYRPQATLFCECRGLRRARKSSVRRSPCMGLRAPKGAFTTAMKPASSSTSRKPRSAEFAFQLRQVPAAT